MSPGIPLTIDSVDQAALKRRLSCVSSLTSVNHHRARHVDSKIVQMSKMKKGLIVAGLVAVPIALAVFVWLLAIKPATESDQISNRNGSDQAAARSKEREPAPLIPGTAPVAQPHPPGMVAPAPAHQDLVDSEDLREMTYDEMLTIVGSEKLSSKIESVRADPDLGLATISFYHRPSAEVSFPPTETGFLNELAKAGVRVDVDLTTREQVTSGGFLSSLKFIFVVLMIVTIAAFVLWRVSKTSPQTAGAYGGFRRSGGGMDGMRSDAQVSDEHRPPAKFADVAGCDEAVEEVSEFLDFLLDPDKFSDLGAKMPAGVLLHGPPGTGKTLLARALAGEANANFFAVSGTDFVERYVGVGPSRMRELFQRARASIHKADKDKDLDDSHRAAVIFFDEIDAIGRARGGAGDNSNDERENTLNELLVQLDGFKSRERLIVIAATNRMDILDQALLRPGRFSRQVQVNLPDAEGREKILRLYAKDKPIAEDVDLSHWAEITAGCSGADLAEMLNESAIMAARANRSEITSADVGEGHLRVLAGPERRSNPASGAEREIIAYHEAGHVLCAELSETHVKAQRATIRPRGPGLGLAVYGLSDKALHSMKSLKEQLICALGGRAAEEIVFEQISSGAADDLRKVNGMARQAVEELGFSEEVGQISHGQAASEETRSAVDREIVRIVSEAYQEALELLREHRQTLEALAKALLSFEDLSRPQIEQTIAAVES